MFLTIQIPFGDLRDFVPNPNRVPSLRIPFAVPNQGFVRAFGQVRKRKRGGIEALAGEDVFCLGSHAIRFRSNLNDPLHTQKLSLVCEFRRLLSNGNAQVRMEIGFRQRMRPRPRTGFDARLCRQVVDIIASFPVQVTTQSNAASEPVQLMFAGKSLCQSYLDSTTKSENGTLLPTKPAWVGAGEPLMLIEFDYRDNAIFPDQSQQIALNENASIELSHMRAEQASQPIAVWFVRAAKGANREFLRNLRIHLLRLHSERECFRFVLRSILRGIVSIEPHTRHTDELRAYLSSTAGLLIRKSYAGFSQSEVFLASHRYDALVSSPEKATLLAMIETVQRQVRRSVSEAIDISLTHFQGAKEISPATYLIGQATFQKGAIQMTTFDQRGQRVAYQYNAAGNIDLGGVNTREQLQEQLALLEAEIHKAAEAKALEREKADDAEYQLRKAHHELEKPGATKSGVMERLEGAKKILQGVVTVGGIYEAITKVIELGHKLL